MSVLQSQNYAHELEGEEVEGRSVVGPPNFGRAVDHGHHLGGYSENEEENQRYESRSFVYFLEMRFVLRLEYIDKSGSTIAINKGNDDFR